MLEEVSGLVHHLSAMTGDVTKLDFVDQSVLGRATDILNKMSKTGSGATRMNKPEKHRFRMVSFIDIEKDRVSGRRIGSRTCLARGDQALPPIKTETTRLTT